MTLLPKLLYFFQALPVDLDHDLLPRLRSLITKFIWQSGKACLPFHVLWCPKKEGFVALPDPSLYYKAAQLRVVVVGSMRESDKHWLHMDMTIVGRSIWDVLWKQKKDRLANAYIISPMRTTLKVSDEATKDGGWTSFPSPYTHIHFNPYFPPALREGPFDGWREGGCLMVSDLFCNFDMLTFESCQREFHVPSSEQFHYLQPKHWVSQPRMREAATRERTPIEQLVWRAGTTKGAISMLYVLLLSTVHAPQARYMSFWEQVVGRDIAEGEWKLIWSEISKNNHSVTLRQDPF